MPIKVIIVSRTHQQLAQMIQELRLRTSVYIPSMIVVASKKHLCINEDVKKNRNVHQSCLDLNTSAHPCVFRNVDRSHLIRKANEVQDIEDLVTTGLRHGICPYYGSMSLIHSSQLVMIPYNYVFDYNISRQVGLNLKDVILVIDEAHNIPVVCAEGSSLPPVELSMILKCLGELRICLKLPLEGNLIHLFQAMSDLYIWITNVEFNETQESIAFSLAVLIDLFKDLDVNEVESMLNSSLMSKMLTFSSDSLIRVLLMIYSQQNLETYLVIVSKSRSLSIKCCSAKRIFSPILESCHSVILASGTLTPFHSMKLELGGIFETLQTTHQVDPDSVYIGICSQMDNVLLTFTHFNLFGLLNVGAHNSIAIPENPIVNGLGKALQSLYSTLVNGQEGILNFFPSFVMLNGCIRYWSRIGVMSRIMGGKTYWVDDGITGWNGQQVMLTVYRGRMSEGFDFRDDLCRMVICKLLKFNREGIGIPYPNIKDPSIIQKIQLQRRLDDWEWIDRMAFMAINQAAGRVLRHKDDFGCIALIDSRFLEKKRFLSPWIRKQTIHSLTFTLY